MLKFTEAVLRLRYVYSEKFPPLKCRSSALCLAYSSDCAILVQTRTSKSKFYFGSQCYLALVQAVRSLTPLLTYISHIDNPVRKGSAGVMLKIGL